MEEIFAGCLGAVLRLFGTIVIALLINPFLCVIATPMVLVRALFGPGAYSEKLKSDYRRIWNRKIYVGGGDSF